MKNADLPAMPIGLAVGPSGDIYGADYSEVGLTKREHFAAMAMQGLLSATNSDGEWTGVNCAAVQAVKEADALLAELEK